MVPPVAPAPMMVTLLRGILVYRPFGFLQAAANRYRLPLASVPDSDRRLGARLVALPLLHKSGVLDGVQQVIGEVGPLGAGGPPGDDQLLLEVPADVEGHFQPAAEVRVAEMVQHHGAGPDHAAGVGVLGAGLPPPAGGAGRGGP